MKETRAAFRSTALRTVDQLENEQNEMLQVMKNVCTNYCGELDAYMRKIDDELSTHNVTDIPTETIESWILNITSILYFTVSGLEEVGIKEDMCRSVRQELYAKAHMEAAGTVADRANIASLAVRDEDLVSQIYNRSYRRIKQKVDSGYEMLNSMKKVMSARITDSEISNSRYSGREMR